MQEKRERPSSCVSSRIGLTGRGELGEGYGDFVERY